MIDFTCVILAGGKSSRMKEDKAFLYFENDTTLIDYQYNKLSKIFKNVYISSKIDKFKKNYRLLLDENKIYSPMVALSSIFEKIEDEKIFIITVDVPFIKKETIIKLIKQSNNHEITIAKTDNINHNLLGVYSKKLIKSINNNINNDMHKINFLIENSNSNTVCFNDKNEFLNLNSKFEYKKAMNILKALASK